MELHFLGRRSRSGALSALAACVLTVTLGCGGTTNGESQAQEGARTSADAPSSQVPMPPRGQAWVIFGADTVVAEVARSQAERSEGLMFREEVPEGTGMLFVFPDVATRSFWMRNTFVPLSIAFLDESHRVVDVKDMEPEDESYTRSDRPAMFALEVRQGWFEEKGIEVGDQAEIVFGPG